MFDKNENFPGEKKIADLLSSLNRVNAPGDFDTRVRARIARGATMHERSWAANLIRVGALAAVAVAIGAGGYFSLKWINTGPNQVEIVTEVAPQDPRVEQPYSNVDTSQLENPARAKPNDELDGKKVNPATTHDNAKSNEPASSDSNSRKNNRRGGSVEFAAREENKIFPRGVSPYAKVPSNATGVNPNTRLHVSQILEFIGVKVSWADNGWRVDSVDANNIAERSGIKAGDIVEAINGQTVDKQTTFPAKFDGKNLRVRRDGASLSIDFKP